MCVTFIPTHNVGETKRLGPERGQWTSTRTSTDETKPLCSKWWQCRVVFVITSAKCVSCSEHWSDKFSGRRYKSLLVEPRHSAPSQAKLALGHYTAPYPSTSHPGTLLLSIFGCCIHIDYITAMWAGQLSRYSDWLRAGRSGIESRWGRDFPHLFRPALWATQPPVKCVPGLSRG